MGWKRWSKRDLPSSALPGLLQCCHNYGNLKLMDRVQEIESAIDALSLEYFRRIANWFRKLDQSLWDQQLDSDASAGALDFLFEETETESHQSLLRDWPAQR
jgi:hypothetical protein